MGIKYLFQGHRRVLIENFVSLSTLEIANMLMSFVTLPYILRVLGQDGYGIYSMAFALMGYLVTLVDYAFSITGTRLVAVNRDIPEKLQWAYSLVMRCKTLLFSCAIIFFLLVVFTIPPFRENYLAYLYALPMVLGNMLFTDWFFQGIEKLRFVTIINVAVKALFTICVFVFIRAQEDVLLYIFLQSMGYVVAGVLAQLIVRKEYKMKLVKITLKDCCHELKRGRYLFANILLPNLYGAGSILLLGIMSDTQEVGIFVSLRKITMLACSLIVILTRVFFPYISRNNDAFKKLARLTMLTALGIVIVLVLVYPIVFWYLDIEDLSFLSVFFVLSVNIIGFSMSKTFGQNFLVTHGKDKNYLKATAISSFIGAILSIPTIYFFSSLGASVTILISNLISGLICYTYYRNIKKSMPFN